MKIEFLQEVENALAALRQGKIILYPTDTVWGLGCDAGDAKAVEKIYRLKQRQETKSMIVLVAEERDILQYVAAPDPAVFTFLEEQQKPTTVIFDGALHLPENLVADDGSIAIRIVQDDFCRHLIKRLQRPLVSTSANISGQPTPRFFSEVSEAIKNGVEHIVQWRQQDETSSQPSQIIRWKGDGEFDVIRK